MNFKNIFIPFLIIITSLFYSCNNSDQNIETDNDGIIDDSDSSLNEHKKKVKMIFYNIPSPVEMASILQKTSPGYNSEILNPHNIYSKYTTNKKVALNLGVYGADLSYSRMFDQIQSSVNYLSAIKKLSDNLGIPQDEGSFTVSRIEENIENRDSILTIISETYSTADAYLKENGRGCTAALIIVGGWIEALYIATQITKEDGVNQEILEKIAEQKYALTNLIELAKTYKDDDDIKDLLPELEELNKKFENIEITYTKGEIITDEVNKTTTLKSQVSIDVTPEVVSEIGIIVERIRTSIVE